MVHETFARFPALASRSNRRRSRRIHRTPGVTMRPILSLLLMLCLAPLCNAETWQVYVHPKCYTSTSTVWSNPDLLRADAFRVGVEETSKALQQYCDLRLQLVSRWQDADIFITTHNPDSYRPMWSSRHGHVAGLYVYHRPDYVVISTGWLPARTVQGNYGYWTSFVGTQKSLSGLICHEIGHHRQIMGPSHQYNLSSIFATPPSGLTDRLVREFGRPPARVRSLAEEDELQGEPWFPNSPWE